MDKFQESVIKSLANELDVPVESLESYQEILGKTKNLSGPRLRQSFNTLQEWQEYWNANVIQPIYEKWLKEVKEEIYSALEELK